MSTGVGGGRDDSSAVRRLERSFEQALEEPMPQAHDQSLSPESRMQRELRRAALDAERRRVAPGGTPGFGRFPPSSPPAVAAASSAPLPVVSSSPLPPPSLAAAAIVAAPVVSSLATDAASISLFEVHP